MAATVLNIELIIADPEIRRGRPIIAGTTLCVSDVVAWYKFGGLTVEDIAQQFQLTMAQVLAALAYAFLH